MSSERVRGRLRHVIEAIDAIGSFTHGLSQIEALADLKTVYAVERALQTITEALIQIGQPGLAALRIDVPFAEIKATGNLLRHEYFRIDHEMLWTTIREDLPPLRAAVMRALDQHG